MNNEKQSWPEKSPLGSGPATEVVLAASDSTGIADYKCSASDDQLVVQQAINVAAAAGKKLRVKSGLTSWRPKGTTSYSWSITQS